MNAQRQVSVGLSDELDCQESCGDALKETCHLSFSPLHHSVGVSA